MSKYPDKFNMPSLFCHIIWNILWNKRDFSPLLSFQNWQKFRRELSNTSNWFIPWEQKIKEIESHFGSVVASYFLFLRWLFWVNIMIAGILLCFVTIPEVKYDIVMNYLHFAWVIETYFFGYSTRIVTWEEWFQYFNSTSNSINNTENIKNPPCILRNVFSHIPRLCIENIIFNNKHGKFLTNSVVLRQLGVYYSHWRWRNLGNFVVRRIKC